MVGQSHSTVEIGQCRWREGDCIVKVLLRTHYPYSGTEEIIMETKLVRIAEISATSEYPIFTSVYHLINEDMLKQCHRYYGVTWNFRKITTFLHRVQQFLFKAMNRRGCRRAYTWNGFVEMLKYYPLAKPKTYYCLY